MAIHAQWRARRSGAKAPDNRWETRPSRHPYQLRKKEDDVRLRRMDLSMDVHMW